MAIDYKKFNRNYKFEKETGYTYVGDHYTWAPPNRPILYYKRFFGILELISIAGFLLASMTPSVHNTSRFVVVPALLCICIWFFEFFTIFMFCFFKFPLKEEDFERIDAVFGITFIARFPLLLFATTAYIFRSLYFSGGLTDIIASAGYLFCTIAALTLHIAYRKLKPYKKMIPSDQSIS